MILGTELGGHHLDEWLPQSLDGDLAFRSNNYTVCRALLSSILCLVVIFVCLYVCM